MTSVIQSDQPVCQGCGIPLSPDENYCCEDCSARWLMQADKQERSESDDESA